MTDKISQSSPLTLQELGEFRLLNELVLPTFTDRHLVRGDDCAFVHWDPEESFLALTADAAPRPLAWELGHHSFFTWGWYSVLINASDLAAAGAEPLTFVSSVEAEPTMTVESFRDFFRGMAAACHDFNLLNAGGNIRQAPRFECHGTALGKVRNPLLTRRGASLGDRVVSIGALGRFATCFLKARSRGLSNVADNEREILVKPRPKLRELLILRSAGLLSAASDNSDGVLGAIWNIAERSECGIELLLDPVLLDSDLKEIAKAEGLNPWNLAFFWGDWQVIVTVPDALWSKFIDTATRSNIEYRMLGKVVGNSPKITAREMDRLYTVNLIRNENFTALSYNSSPLEQVKYLFNAPLLGAPL